MDIPARSRTHAAGIPNSPFSVSDPQLRGRVRPRIGDMPERKPANHRTGLLSSHNSRWSLGKLACNRAAHMHGKIGFLPSPSPAPHVSWRPDANRITEKIVVWAS
jgi:hypothetical protein